MMRAMENEVKHTTKGHIIVISLILIITVSHLLFVLALRQLLTGNTINPLQNAFWSIVLLTGLFCLFLGLLITFVSLPVNRIYSFILPLLVGITALLYPGSISIKFGLFITTALSLSLFSYIYHKAIAMHTSVDFVHIAFPKLAIIINLYALVIAFLIFAVTQKQVDSFSFTLDPKLLNEVINFTQPVINEQLETQRQKFLESATQQLDEQLPFLASIPTADKLQLLEGQLPISIRIALEEQGLTPSQITAFQEQVASSLSMDQFNIDTSSINNSIIESIGNQAQELINSLIQKNRTLIPIIISSSVFFSITFVGILIKAFAILLAIAISKLLIALKLIQERSATITTKRLEIIE